MIDLKKIREKCGLSQMRLAKLSKVSRYRIHLHESGYSRLNSDEERRIRKAVSFFRSKELSL